MGKTDHGGDINLLFVGFLVDDKTFNTTSCGERFPQHAAHAYQKKLLDVFEKCCLNSVDILGSPPISSFPKNPKLILKARAWSYKGIKAYMPFLLNLPFLKEVSRFLGTLKHLLKWLMAHKKYKNSSNVVFLYALHTPHLIPIFILKKLFGFKLVIFIPDIPIFMRAGSYSPFYIHWLKTLDNHLLIWLANSADGGVLITKKMHTFFNFNNYIVVDSIALEKIEITAPNVKLPKGKNFIYTGGLSEEYGVEKLVNFFSSDDFKSQEVNLVLCGGGVLAEWCEKVAFQRSNIYYLGVVSNDEVLSIQKKAFALINMRHTESDYTKYSFPSKIAEYLQAGVPVITTKLDGIPSDLLGHLTIVDENNLNAVVMDLIINYESALKKAKESTSYYMSTRSVKQQSKKLSELIKKLE